MSIMLTHLPEALAAAVAEASQHEGDEGAVPSLRFGRQHMSGSAPTPPSDDRAAIDAQLLRRMAAGDKAALAELYDRFSRPLYATALRIVNDPSEAQDLVHDAFIALWEKAGVFENERGSAFVWAVTLVRNRAIDRVRSRRRRGELLAASLPSDLGYDETPDDGADTTAASADQARAVRAAVATLPLEQKRALELAFFGGLTQQEIAQKLSEPLGTVKARIRRGLLKLRDSLAHRL
jgi:RNA polymerase sigma-70 factor (ECF subfamily)